jgi:hypothetical protein
MGGAGDRVVGEDGASNLIGVRHQITIGYKVSDTNERRVLVRFLN